ncbi:hypothetical protein Tco_0601820 [Tanacetum coccineum]
MASHRSKSLYAIKECSTCGRLYTKECCSIGSLKDKILVPEPDSSPRCARCGTPVDGPSCRGCAFLRKKFDEDLLAYCVENGIFKDFQDTSESSDDNTNVVNALREPCVVNQDPGEKSSQEPPQIDHNCCYECGDSLDGIFCRQCICKSCGKGAHYGYNCPPKVLIISNPEQCNQTFNELPHILPIVHPTCNYEAENSFAYDPNPNSFDNSPNFSYPPPQPQFETYSCELCGNYAHYGYDCSPQFPFDSVNCQEALDKILEELEELKRDQRMLKELKKQIAEEQTVKENMSIEEMMHEHQLVDRKIKEITNDLGIRRFRGEEIVEEYERICEITIRKLKQNFNIWGSEVRKKEKAYENEKYAAACRYMLFVTCDDEGDYIPSGDIIARYSTSTTITPDLPIEESENSLIMGDDPLSTIPATESGEVIKSSVENLVPIPSEFEGISDDTSDVPKCDNNRVNVESDFVESLSNRDTSIVYSSKIDPILEEFADELAHIAPIPPGIVEADFDPNDDDYDDNFYDCVDIEEDGGEIDLDISKIVDISLREKLVESYLLIEKINTFNLSPPIPISPIICPSSTIPVVDLDLPLEEADVPSFSDDSMIFPEYESFTFDDEPVMAEVNIFDEINTSELSYPGIGENDVLDEEEDTFTFTTRSFLPFVTYPEVLPASYSTGSDKCLITHIFYL